MSLDVSHCHFKMIEIYSGKEPKWKGWHNLVLVIAEDGNHKAIAGPVDPETSLQMIAALKKGMIPQIPNDAVFSLCDITKQCQWVGDNAVDIADCLGHHDFWHKKGYLFIQHKNAELVVAKECHLIITSDDKLHILNPTEFSALRTQSKQTKEN